MAVKTRVIKNNRVKPKKVRYGGLARKIRKRISHQIINSASLPATPEITPLLEETTSVITEVVMVVKETIFNLPQVHCLRYDPATHIVDFCSII